MRFEHAWRFQKDDTRLLAILCGVLLFAGVVTGALWPPLTEEVLLLGSFTALAGVILNLHRLRQHEARHYLEHQQGLHFLHKALPLRAPLPPLTGWAASPQLAGMLVALIRREKPRRIVELGSGASTVAMAYVLQQLGHGHLTSIDHSEEYARRTTDMLAQHGLQAQATVRHVPLTESSHDGTEGPWYALKEEDPDLFDIDLLVVDGPPHATAPKARCPAATYFCDRLSEGAFVVLDDALRESEQRALDRWRRLLDDPDVRIEETVKGIATLQRTSQPSASPRPARLPTDD